MKRFFIVLGLIVITSIGLWAVTELDGYCSVNRVLGMPALCVGSVEPAWLTLGMGTGVLVVGGGGVGVVAITAYGAGILFATGQLSAGLIAFGQLGFGLILFLGQVGAGTIAAGQAVGGGLVWAQGGLGYSGKEFIKELNTDIADLMKFR